MPLLNFTNRDDIDRSLVEIAANETSPSLVVYLKTKQAFRQNEHFAGCDIVFEASMGMKAQRKELGRIDDLVASKEVRFDEFTATEKPSFCLKAVSPGNKKIVGIVEGLRLNTEPQKEEDADRKSILPVNWANETDNMKNRFWKIGFGGAHPVLLLQRGKFSALGEVNQPEFQALAFPQIMTEILTYAFVVHFANPPTWSDDWEKLADLLGVEPRPILERSGDGASQSSIEEHLDAVLCWIDQVADRFAADQKLMRIDSQFKRG